MRIKWVERKSVHKIYFNHVTCSAYKKNEKDFLNAICERFALSVKSIFGWTALFSMSRPQFFILQFQIADKARSVDHAIKILVVMNHSGIDTECNDEDMLRPSSDIYAATVI